MTFDPYFRLHTTLLGINVADCWKLARYHDGLLTQACQHESASEESFSIRKFAGVLAHQLLEFAAYLERPPFLASSNSADVPSVVVTRDSEQSASSSPSFLSGDSGHTRLTDVNGDIHVATPFPASKERNGIKPRRCHGCREEGKQNSGGWARHSCSRCNKAYCLPLERN